MSLLPKATEDGLVFDLAQPSDEEAIVDLAANDFCMNEPLNRSQKFPSDVGAPIMRILIRFALGQGISLKATDSKTGQLVAVRMTFLNKKDPSEDEKRAGDEAMNEVDKILPDRAKPFKVFLTEVASKNVPDIYETYGVDKYVEFFFVNVHKSYNGRGIAQRILELSYELFKSLDIPIVKVIATNPRTAHIFRKSGFEEVGSYQVLDFLHDGKPYFAGVQELETVFTFIKDLRNN